MQIQLFAIPIGDNGAALQEMNTFLKAHKILEIQQKLISNDNGANWCFCVRYVEQAFKAASESKAKIDYRQVLDEQTFRKFSHLRAIRKKVSATEGLSAFIVFTDEELAELAKLEEITIKSMLGIKGIGEKKIERFAHYFMDKPQPNEAPGGDASADS
ncbi:MAG: HRDC domain-containing protein [Chlorobium sp.]|uniref:HRDC domain-containing protein n=1 Tax=Chlorobium sp. TaxID=1095 RepID=UPI0025B857DB|nr:HRDC domain-containing protein [Chlorobium sp.]MCF8216106.1 HRDC domain-containing protein [Chlorobium sp.]MCF8271007.1 HRDC domain-containing protein [Chlorobium sp.]MCF8287347.1 HRDC domain-containing protein [Chlorobium sp.]MCF8290920.1 HRDC domain-containing protein [Chlorobium sp.]MCF8385015.1 HRDC domain-containing protein [Chlorobium sp.]